MSSEVVELFSFSRISWRIENFSQVSSEAGLDSTVFSVGSSKWKARIFPKGKGGVYDQLSLFFVPVDAAILPYAEITAVVTSQTDRCYNVAKDIKYQFLETNIGNGWSEFMPLSALHDPVKGYIVQDTCVIRIDVFSRARANRGAIRCPNLAAVYVLLNQDRILSDDPSIRLKISNDQYEQPVQDRKGGWKSAIYIIGIEVAEICICWNIRKPRYLPH